MFVQQEGTSCRRYSHLTLRRACTSERSCCTQLARVELASCRCEFYVLIADYAQPRDPSNNGFGLSAIYRIISGRKRVPKHPSVHTSIRLRVDSPSTNSYHFGAKHVNVCTECVCYDVYGPTRRSTVPVGYLGAITPLVYPPRSHNRDRWCDSPPFCNRTKPILVSTLLATV